MSNYYDFHERLSFSKGVVAATSIETVKQLVPGCVGVAVASTEMDKTGVDFIATLRRGTHVYIDHKVRERGCSRYWQLGRDGQPEPEIAIELWSVKPRDGNTGKAGWTLDESKNTHYTMHTFDPSDSADAFLFPFQLLRKAYRSNYHRWNDDYKHAIQDSGTWESECVFVPVGVVIDAIQQAMQLTTS